MVTASFRDFLRKMCAYHATRQGGVPDNTLEIFNLELKYQDHDF